MPKEQAAVYMAAWGTLILPSLQVPRLGKNGIIRYLLVHIDVDAHHFGGMLGEKRFNISKKIAPTNGGKSNEFNDTGMNEYDAVY